MRNSATSVQPRLWRSATPAEVERAAGQCAICWGEMAGEARRDAHGTPRNTSSADMGEADQGSVSEAAARGAPPPAAQREQQGQQAGLPDAWAPYSQAQGSAAASGADAAALPCSHAFHRDCLQQWMQQCYA